MSQKLFDFLVAEAEHHFSGWDFSYISRTGRTAMEPLPWGYAGRVLAHLPGVHSLLDMGTGGGEFLSALHPLPPHTCATEGYAPNVPIATARLEPLGVQVYAVEEDASLPFADDTFDLIINRHESYHPAEIGRVCQPGGTFITQQVGGQNNLDLNAMLGADTAVAWGGWQLPLAVAQLEQAGWQVVEQREAFPHSRFYDVGALVYHLKAVSWQIPDFSVERYFEPLSRLHRQIEQNGYLDITDHRFFIIARKGQ
jgi:SAM-dependent methyltransferase